MKINVKSKLQELRADYTQVAGQPFAHFYCPMLFRDEDVPLCQAHIINKPFPDSSRDWTVQRVDVDSFYGSKFEADFIDILYNESGSPGKVLTDKTLSKRFQPRIFVDGKPVDHFAAKDNIPERFTPVEFRYEGQSVQLGLKMSPEDFSAVAERKLEIEIDKDVRIPALVSLIKAAHLTLFDMLGYRYALSAGGHFVGRQILGEFFHQNYDKQKADALKNAHSFFREFAHIVRPVQSLDFDLQGTIADNKLFICWGSGRSPWALIVFIKTSRSLHAVLVPVFDQPGTVATFLDFLQDENNLIEGSFGCFKGGHWEIGKEVRELVWPKTGVLYPE
jgi:hypothetical protein